MQKIVIVANGAPYGSESLFNSLRLAIALREQESNSICVCSSCLMRSQPGCAGKNQGRLQHSANAGDPYRSECTGEIVQNLYRRARD